MLKRLAPGVEDEVAGVLFNMFPNDGALVDGVCVGSPLKSEFDGSPLDAAASEATGLVEGN